MKLGKSPRSTRRPVWRTVVAVAAAGTLIGVAFVPGMSNASQSTGSKQEVKVVNPPEEAVPVTGSVGVSGAVGLAPGAQVAAHQGGPWSVSVSGAPPVQLDPAANGVQVLNDSSRPIPVRVEGGSERAMFQRYFIMGVDGGQRCESAGLQLVPDGTRLVVTSINTHMYPLTGVGVRTWVQAHRADGSFANIHVPYEKQDYHDDQNDRDDYVGAVETNLVHENAYPFFVTICMSQPAPGDSANSLGVFQGTIVGYTEPISS